MFIDPTARSEMYLGSVRSSNLPFKVQEVGYVRSSLPLFMHFGSIATPFFLSNDLKTNFPFAAGAKKSMLPIEMRLKLPLAYFRALGWHSGVKNGFGC